MRASGILLPVSSLPSKYGIGCFSEEAYEFVDQLARAGQKYWQILPLGPTGYGDSPYQSFSTFAGNPYFIDLEAFVKEGYLEVEAIPDKLSTKVQKNLRIEVQPGGVYTTIDKIPKVNIETVGELIDSKV